MISNNSARTLVCPDTRQLLVEADTGLVKRLNALIDNGELMNRVDAAVTERMDSAFVRDDRQYAYPVIDGIAKMLVDEAIPLVQLDE